MATLQELLDRVVSLRDERDWKQFHNPKDMLLSLMIEVAELAEIAQWKNGTELQDVIVERREELGHELCDVLYWVLLLAHDLEVDLGSAFEKKMALNEAKYPVEKSRGRSTKYSQL
jgi:NTP pyrophosphatase (non-canonical NTP hydrolase)